MTLLSQVWDFATTEDGDILDIGKADDLTQRCKISQHHKLPIAIVRGATVLQETGR